MPKAKLFDLKTPPAEPIEWTVLVKDESGKFVETTCVVRARLWHEARMAGAMLLGSPVEKVDVVEKT